MFPRHQLHDHVVEPPIRVGKNELHAMLSFWLPRLESGADAWMVVQKPRLRFAAALARGGVCGDVLVLAGCYQ